MAMIKTMVMAMITVKLPTMVVAQVVEHWTKDPLDLTSKLFQKVSKVLLGK